VSKKTAANLELISRNQQRPVSNRDGPGTLSNNCKSVSKNVTAASVLKHINCNQLAANSEPISRNAPQQNSAANRDGPVTSSNNFKSIYRTTTAAVAVWKQITSYRLAGNSEVVSRNATKTAQTAIQQRQTASHSKSVSINTVTAVAAMVSKQIPSNQQVLIANGNLESISRNATPEKSAIVSKQINSDQLAGNLENLLCDFFVLSNF